MAVPTVCPAAPAILIVKAASKLHITCAVLSLAFWGRDGV